MHVAVGIVGFRNVDDIVNCLGALERSTHADFEVVICENGGHEAYEALLAAVRPELAGDQPVRIIEASGNVGYAGGVNLCLAAAPAADAWWVLNPDAAPQPEAMAALLARLGQGDCDAAGCTVYLPGDIVQSHGGVWQTKIGRAVSIGNGSPLAERPDPADIERRQNYLNGACMMIGRRFMDTVGPMREDYFLYCEEVEWCLRALKQGMRLGFAPDALVLHHQGSTTGHVTDVRQRPRTPIYLNERNKLLMTRDLYAGLVPLVAAASFALLFAKYGRRRAWRQVGFGLQGWLAGLGGKRGKPAWIGA